MEIKKRKEVTLFWMFLRRVIGMAVAIGIEAIVFISAFGIGLNAGFILPANYAENYLKQEEDNIAESMPFNNSLIPDMCAYGVFDKEGKYESGNLNNKWQNIIHMVIEGTKKQPQNIYLIERNDGYVAVKYDMSAHFAHPTWNRLIPNAEIGAICLFLLVLIFIVLANSLKFGKQLKKEINPLLEEIAQIKEKDLEIIQKSTKIKEFNDVLTALNDMEKALAQSLQTEWETEQRRKENISAIAHDIKTPLTVIKGNAELLKEENDIEEIYSQADIVIQNADKIQNYIRMLMEEANGSADRSERKETELEVFINDIEKQCRNLCRSKNVAIKVIKPEVTERVMAESILIQRAVMNLVTNATEYTDKRKGIKISFQYENPVLRIEIEDFGNGFSESALKHATEQLYTERKERSGGHYGLGMYFANDVAKQYEGCLYFKNKENQQGAIVVFEIKLC
ncbi:MAG: HAMP domain-containing histidine kinase [Lachnospiraceae bacterium]|nr:HAMP domain-containing histidine kinase [Lachnospiraceae bacterium]